MSAALQKEAIGDWTFQGVTLLVGDVLARLADIADDSVDCVVTSPPYWGLRDYGVDGQIGLERHLEEHIDLMVEVFREVRRVLKPTGTCFVNYGDCYATAPNGRSAAETKAAGGDDRTFRDKPFSTVQGAMKSKDLCMVPNRFAIAMQDDGWWVRSEIIWAKPNPMPESIKDRPATAHEKLFLFTKSARYDWNADAVRQESVSSTRDYKMPDGWDTGPGTHDSRHRNGREKGKPADRGRSTYGRHTLETSLPQDQRRDGRRGLTPRHTQDNNQTNLDNVGRGSGRSLRNYEPAPMSVWRVATRPFKDAHFATFPPELVERCLLAGCPDGGHVLDIFGGSGTTGLVAMAMGRRCTLIELNPDYADMAEQRIRGAWMGSAEKTWATARQPETATSLGALFDWADAGIAENDL